MGPLAANRLFHIYILKKHNNIENGRAWMDCIQMSICYLFDLQSWPKLTSVFQNCNQKTPRPPKSMLNENRSHKQQHCLRGKGAGRYIMARIVASISTSLYIENPSISTSLYRKSHYLNYLSISNIPLSQLSLYLKHPSISTIPLSQTSFYLKHPSISTISLP